LCDGHFFATLDPSISLRRSIPSAVALMLGFETVLATFFFTTIGMCRDGVTNV
jgi:hypothetical protein